MAQVVEQSLEFNPQYLKERKGGKKREGGKRREEGRKGRREGDNVSVKCQRVFSCFSPLVEEALYSFSI
jgi:hypothetical protein